jgi:hypothetical protein
MSRVRLYLDEDTMRRSLVFGLRARSVDVLTALETEMINRADEAHLSTAANLGRVLYTYNTADFCILHQDWTTRKHQHAGIVVASQQRYSVGEELRRLMRLIAGLSAEQMQNRLEFLSSSS